MRIPITALLLTLCVGAAALFGLGGCTADDLQRAQTYDDTAHSALDYAVGHVDALQAQLDIAKKALAESGDARVAAVVQQLEGAVGVANAALPAIQQATTEADTALASLKAQAAQGVVPWWQVLLGIAVPILLPLAKGIPVVGPLVGQLGEVAWSAYSTAQQKAQQAATERKAAALTQTVAGIENAKDILPAPAVDALHAELAKAQDEASKATISVLKAAGDTPAALAA